MIIVENIRPGSINIRNKKGRQVCTDLSNELLSCVVISGEGLESEGCGGQLPRFHPKYEILFKLWVSSRLANLQYVGN